MNSVLITGASSGIGQQLALDYDSDGFEVIACGRNQQRLRQLQQTRPKITTLAFDVTDQQALHQALASLPALPSLIILNAGDCEYINHGKIDSDLVQRIVASNFFGVVNMLEALQDRLNSGSHIGIISSSVTLLALPRAEAYGESKAALDYFIGSLAIDWHGRGISFSQVFPGFVKTPLTAQNGFAMPMLVSVTEAADTIRRGLSKRQPRIYFPKRFTLLLRAIATLPYSWQLSILKKLAGEPL